MTALTIAQKILSSHLCEGPGRAVTPGELVFCGVDLMMLTDAAAPLALKAFEKLGGTKVKHPSRMAAVMDHCAPPPNEKLANGLKDLRVFAKTQGIHLFDIGVGVCHQLMVERGLVKSGDIAIGSDSHTCTYGAVGAFACGVGATDLMAAAISGKTWFKVPETIKIVLKGRLKKYCTAKDVILTVIGKLGADFGNYIAFEFYGDYLESCPLADRMTMANMIVEMGGKVGFMCRSDFVVKADEGAVYKDVIEFDLGDMVPCLARPHTVDNWSPVSELAGMPFDYAYLGTCTNGRIEDLRLAASILRGKKIAPSVRLQVTPASNSVLVQAAAEGLLKDLTDAGAAIFMPSCAVCVGTHGGVPADGEVVLSTANRNFKGRMGNNKASIYLVSPATLAVSCLTGVLTDPTAL